MSELQSHIKPNGIFSNAQREHAGVGGTGGRMLQDNRPETIQRKKIAEALSGNPVQQEQSFPVVQLARKPKAKKAAGGAKPKKAAGSTGRYPGHDSTANKHALIDVLNHRNGNLSYPEATAHAQSLAAGAPVTGLGNATATMARGTAICHKISDNSIRTKIDALLDAEKKSGSKTNLNNYLQELVDYIKPDHAAHDTPDGGAYAKEAKKKHIAACAALSMAKSSGAASKSRKDRAHAVGKNVANSPVNLFLGDSTTNSAIQAHFDQNTYAAPAGQDAPLTPRSSRAAPVNDLPVRTAPFIALQLPSGRTKKSSRPGDT